MKTLNIGQQIEMRRGTDAPMVDGRPMTIGDLIAYIVPVSDAGTAYMRVWNLGSDIDRAIGANEDSFEIEEEDWKLLRRTVIDNNNHPVWGKTWAKANLEMAFDEE